MLQLGALTEIAVGPRFVVEMAEQNLSRTKHRISPKIASSIIAGRFQNDFVISKRSRCQLPVGRQTKRLVEIAQQLAGHGPIVPQQQDALGIDLLSVDRAGQHGDVVGKRAGRRQIALCRLVACIVDTGHDGSQIARWRDAGRSRTRNVLARRLRTAGGQNGTHE